MFRRVKGPDECDRNGGDFLCRTGLLINEDNVESSTFPLVPTY